MSRIEVPRLKGKTILRVKVEMDEFGVAQIVECGNPAAIVSFGPGGPQLGVVDPALVASVLAKIAGALCEQIHANNKKGIVSSGNQEKTASDTTAL